MAQQDTHPLTTTTTTTTSSSSSSSSSECSNDPPPHIAIDDDSDDEVQVLLTILPPSPAKKGRQHREVTPAGSSSRKLAAVEASTGSAVANPPPDKDSSVSLPLHKETRINGREPDGLRRNIFFKSARYNKGNTKKDQKPDSKLPPSTDTEVSFETTKKDSEHVVSIAIQRTKQGFSPRSSAYLQSLAEICHAMLWDARWRVQGTHNPLARLVAWEYGDDLSLIHALSRRYLPTSLLPLPVQECTCLLCRHHQNKDKDNSCAMIESSNDTALTGNEEYNETDLDTMKSNHDSTSTEKDPEDYRPTNETHQQDTEEEDPEMEGHDRMLNLYARLYFRKGPWFHLGDIFKYYAPKRPPREVPNQESQPPAGVDPVPQETFTDTTTTTPSTKPAPITRAQFFLPKPSNMDSTTNSNNSKSPALNSPNRIKRSKHFESHIDQDHINSQLEAVVTLLEDVQHLFRLGFVRSFQDERECGLTVGRVEKYGLLTQEEQRVVLGKLGGSTKKRSPRSSGRSGSFTSDRQTKNMENQIWRQMCQQQSILVKATPSPKQSQASIRRDSGPKTILLPVAKHVDQVLLGSWATQIVLKGSKVDYVPHAITKALVAPVLGILQQKVKEYEIGRQQEGVGISLLCLRLREAPLRCLRRCSRLYLCATSGPGQMRGDAGNSPWKSLPLERNSADDDEGARGEALPRTNIVPPPGSQSWHHVFYPGKDYRLKLTSCSFQRAFRPISLERKEGTDETQGQVSIDSETLSPQVFSTASEFSLWELTVDIRATVDYLVEANELFLYNKRKEARENKLLEIQAESISDVKAASASQELSDPSRVDFLQVLTQAGRDALVRRFASGVHLSPDMTSKTIENIERDIKTLFESGSEERSKGPQLHTGFERVLTCIGVVSLHVLLARNQTVPGKEVDRVLERPWLRHLWWEGCLAYVVWDVIPIFERRGFYSLAIAALETVLFGMRLPRKELDSPVPDTLIPPANQAGRSFVARTFVSRRARGKAYERLVIDYVHVLRQLQKQTSTNASESEEDNLKTKGRKKKRRKVEPKKPGPTQYANDTVVPLCRELIVSSIPSGQITFCAARTLAKRLKQPLSTTLLSLEIFETQELGHRLSSQNGKALEENSGSAPKKYSDWVPETDFAVAHAMATDADGIGGRCSYVGFEETESPSATFTSLNVEELALEYYHSGRLPKETSGLRGGWIGWHDEGGKLRTLFRILTAESILGMDWGCPKQHGSHHPTIFLTPYQGAPFDLHVGAEQSRASSTEHMSRLGFYQRRQTAIHQFLESLQNLNQDEVADLVWRSIASRRRHAITKAYSDPMLERDINQARTLAAVAAGFGGKMLAAAFRCYFFDYRHYSGGLPDLTLFRAVYQRSGNQGEALVDLAGWIGEAFSEANQIDQESQKIARMFQDQDEDFLGCSKVGDSGGQSQTARRFGRVSRLPSRGLRDEKEVNVLSTMPPRVQMMHGDRAVRVECMLVEVKSASDRLDARQEDWLNVLDSFGNVRVCKFESKKTVKSANK